MTRVPPSHVFIAWPIAFAVGWLIVIAVGVGLYALARWLMELGT